MYLKLQLLKLMLEILNHSPLLENVYEPLRLNKLLHALDVLVHFVRELIESLQGLSSKVLRRWLVALHTLQVSYDVLGTLFLLVNDALQIVVLLLYLVQDFILQTHLVGNSLLHLRALTLVFLANLQDFLKLGHLVGC